VLGDVVFPIVSLTNQRPPECAQRIHVVFLRIKSLRDRAGLWRSGGRGFESRRPDDVDQWLAARFGAPFVARGTAAVAFIADEGAPRARRRIAPGVLRDAYGLNGGNAAE
jgi:hypothetical protein